MGKEELLSRDGARRVDDDLLALLDGLVEEGVDIREEGSYNVTRLVALQPEVSLEGLEVGDLDVAFHEIADMGLQVWSRVAILFGKGIAVLCKLGTIPLLVEDLGKSFEGVWELAPSKKALVSLSCPSDDTGRAEVGEGETGEAGKIGVACCGQTSKQTKTTCIRPRPALLATWHNLVWQPGGEEHRELGVRAGR